MEIVYRKLSDLKPNPKNPRKSTKEAIEKLAESIKKNPKFFEARPVLLSDRTGELVIIGGERRYEAAAIAGMKKAPTILITGLTEEEEDEIMVRDNTHAGEWDTDVLLKEWNNGVLIDWGVPNRIIGNIPAGDVNLDGLFGPNKKVEQKPKPKPIYLQVEIPIELAEKVDNVKAAIIITLEEFPGCKVL